jgi:hypothetical protein
VKFCAHLQRVDEGYFQHMRHALGFVLELVIAAVCCLVHAFLPFLFEKAGSQRIARLHDRMVVNRHRLSHPDLEPRTSELSEDSVGSLS